MKYRCSSLGKLMTSPRTKSELLSETAKTYIQDYFKEKECSLRQCLSLLRLAKNKLNNLSYYED